MCKYRIHFETNYGNGYGYRTVKHRAFDNMWDRIVWAEKWCEKRGKIFLKADFICWCD